MNKVMLSTFMAMALSMNQAMLEPPNTTDVELPNCEDTYSYNNYESVDYSKESEQNEVKTETLYFKKDISEPKYKTKKMYATTNVHIRSKPSIKSKSLGVLNFGKKINHIEKMENKWSKVIYKDKICYIYSKYLSLKKPKKPKLPKYVEYSVPKNNSFKSYESGNCITRNKKIPQGKLHSQYVTDYNTGIYTVNGRYCIALGSYYSTKVGTNIDLVMQNGSVVQCILADCKADKDTDKINRQHNIDGSVVEFVVNIGALPRMVKIMGDLSYASKQLKGEIKSIRVYK